MTKFDPRLVARIALLLPKLSRRAEVMNMDLHRYCLQYGYGKPAHAKYIARLHRADRDYCRAYNYVLDAAGKIAHYPRAVRFP